MPEEPSPGMSDGHIFKFWHRMNGPGLGGCSSYGFGRYADRRPRLRLSVPCGPVFSPSGHDTVQAVIGVATVRLCPARVRFGGPSARRRPLLTRMIKLGCGVMCAISDDCRMEPRTCLTTPHVRPQTAVGARPAAGRKPHFTGSDWHVWERHKKKGGRFCNSRLEKRRKFATVKKK